MALSNTHAEFGLLANTLPWAVHSSIALLVVHVVAALYHHFVAKNDVLRRMTLGARRA
jgi:cytochrome b561